MKASDFAALSLFATVALAFIAATAALMLVVEPLIEWLWRRAEANEAQR